ncbi:hypothetical protein VP01_4161g1 [Puccinia sorghi]|uniref:Uncharacterized protein n=1 Tax=Puccinia sorghi TaxID=27349 RepID=A0A0L6UQY8_9BASI|nr:hypothetical protein VP01_4161g1 [Puccinia sorghi]
MSHYFVKSLGSLIPLLIAQGILAFNSALTPDKIVASFDLNEYPPSEPTILSLSSTPPTTSSEYASSLPREHPEKNLVLSTAKSIPNELASPSSLKRKKVTKSYEEQMRNIRQRVSEQHRQVMHNNGIPQEEQALLVNNWDYVKLDLKPKEIPNDIYAGYGKPEMNEEDFFNYMHDKSYLQNGETYWIPRNLIEKFHDRNRQVRIAIPYPAQVSYHIKQSGIRDIMLKIAEDKLQINSCWRSLGGIKTQLQQCIDTAKGPTDYFIRKITKLSVTMSVLYLTLFGENEGPTLSPKHISSTLDFMQDAMIFLSETPVPAEFPGSKLAQKWRKIWNNRAAGISNASKEMKLAWDMAEYWLVMTRGLSDTTLTRASVNLHEIINKIIFFSNYKYFILKDLENKIKERRKIVLKARDALFYC